MGRAPPGRRLPHACPAAARLGRSPQAAAVRGTGTRIQIETRDLSLEVGTDERREVGTDEGPQARHLVFLFDRGLAQIILT